jgi:translation elongation factor EF-4
MVECKKPFRALVFDSVYDVHRGAIVYIACFDGEIKRGDKISSYFTNKTYEVQEVGIVRPEFVPVNKL